MRDILEKARVLTVNDNGTAQVEMLCGSTCSGKCSLCPMGGAKNSIGGARARNTAAAAEGDAVLVRTISRRRGGMLNYAVPLVLFFVFYFIASQLGLSQRAASISCIAVLLAAYGAIAVIRAKRLEKYGNLEIVRLDV